MPKTKTETFEEAIRSEENRLKIRTETAEKIVNSTIQRSIKQINTTTNKNIQNIQPYTFPCDLKNYMKWISSYKNKKQRSQSPSQWIDSNKGKKYGCSYFVHLFITVANYVANLVTIIEPDDKESCQLLQRHLLDAVFCDLLQAQIPSGKDAGLRPLVCDSAFTNKSKKEMSYFISELLKMSGMKMDKDFKKNDKTQRKLYLINYYKDKASDYLGLYYKNKFNQLPKDSIHHERHNMQNNNTKSFFFNGYGTENKLRKHIELSPRNDVNYSNSNNNNNDYNTNRNSNNGYTYNSNYNSKQNTHFMFSNNSLNDSHLDSPYGFFPTDMDNDTMMDDYTVQIRFPSNGSGMSDTSFQHNNTNSTSNNYNSNGYNYDDNYTNNSNYSNNNNNNYSNSNNTNNNTSNDGYNNTNLFENDSSRTSTNTTVNANYTSSSNIFDRSQSSYDYDYMNDLNTNFFYDNTNHRN